MKKISIDIPHFYCLEYKEDEKRLIVDLHKYQAVSAGAVSGPGYFGKRPGKGGQ